MQRFYLDHNATSPLLQPVREAMAAAIAGELGNPGSVHAEGQRARGIVEQTRRAMLRALPGAKGTITFTSGATESNNLILRTYAKRGPIVLSRLDHPSVVSTGEALAEQGFEVRWVPSDERGRLDMNRLVELLDGAELFSIASANNELGILRDVHALADLSDAAGTVLHLDAAQTFCRFEMDDASRAGAITLSAHKAGGPSGIGALYLRDGVTIEPLASGGHQERGRRPGTENLLGVVGWQALLDSFSPAAWTCLAALRDQLESFLVRECGAEVNAGVTQRMSNTSNLSIPGVASEAMVMAMDLEGIAISAGSACTAGSIDVSSVLLALGLPKGRAETAIRLSLGPEWTHDMTLETCERFRRVVARVRR